MRRYLILAVCAILSLNLAGCGGALSGIRGYSYTAQPEETASGEGEETEGGVENTFTDDEESKVILETVLEQSARVKVAIRINVFGENEMVFKGFTLFYKTENDEEIEVLRHETDEYASGGYVWKDTFITEVDLPEGKNELICAQNGGKNYKVRLSVKASEAE